jgi:hypothetical protein
MPYCTFIIDSVSLHSSQYYFLFYLICIYKLCQTPGLRSRPQRINSACERYQQEGKVAPLEGLVEATRDISHIDRSDIYYHLLLSYCKLNTHEDNKILLKRVGSR